MASTIMAMPLGADACIFCFHRRLYYSVRAFHTSSRRLKKPPHTSTSSSTNPNPGATPKPQTNPQEPSSPPTAHPATGRSGRLHIRARDGELVPQPLSRPLGLTYPPHPGQNSGVDERSWRERRDDFQSYEKHLQRRRGLIKQLYEKNYFRDIGNVGRVHKGKSILAPTTPFKKEVALYFPNLRGRTLADVDENIGGGAIAGAGAGEVDTTPVLRSRVSIVSVFNSEWGKLQCDTFLGEKENPALHRLLKEDLTSKTAQLVQINVEENWLKWGLIRMFTGSLRRTLPKEQWKRYFLVRRGVTDEIRDALGIWNSKVGHVYLLDGQCKVRWAGNGDAREEETQSLVNCLRRLVEEARGVRGAKMTRQDPKPTGQLSGGQATGKPAISSST